MTFTTCEKHRGSGKRYMTENARLVRCLRCAHGAKKLSPADTTARHSTHTSQYQNRAPRDGPVAAVDENSLGRTSVGGVTSSDSHHNAQVSQMTTRNNPWSMLVIGTELCSRRQRVGPARMSLPGRGPGGFQVPRSRNCQHPGSQQPGSGEKQGTSLCQRKKMGRVGKELASWDKVLSVNQTSSATTSE